MKDHFLFCAGYGFALALLILSVHVTPSLLELFVDRQATLATPASPWLNWHAMGCAFVALVNAEAHGWTDATARRGVAMASAGIFGIWCAQNVVYALRPEFTALMCLHVAGCGLAGAASLAFVLCSGAVSRE